MNIGACETQNLVNIENALSYAVFPILLFVSKTFKLKLTSKTKTSFQITK